jgi:hypothetical protein
MARPGMLLVIFGIAGLGVLCNSDDRINDFRTFVFEGDVSFSIEYPADWSVTRSADVVHFMAEPDQPPTLELVVYDPALAPPLAVHVTYDTLRVVESPHGSIPVMARDPSAVTERYVAFIRFDSHVAEFRLYAEREYDAVFDHMLVTANRINSP